MRNHEPVLLEEVIRELHIKKSRRYIDCTLGVGGYTKAILEKGGVVLGIDTDLSMIEIATDNLKRSVELKKDQTFTIAQGNFRDLKKIASENGFTQVDGIVMDLGVSNVHFSDENRGFSFKNPQADLDMRLDLKSQSLRASDLLNALRQDQLEELFGRNLALKIVDYRRTKKFDKVGDFLSLFPETSLRQGYGGRRKIHPATKAFMNLRIAVNSELDNLREVLPQAWELLKSGGRLVVVSFHSGEDELVKHYFTGFAGGKTKQERIKPTQDEIRRNPKSRSAILRSITKS